MDPRTEVNRYASPDHTADNGAVATEATREPAAASAQPDDPSSSVSRSHEGTQRESVDPMRATDRYRLVHPVTAGS